MNNKQKQLREYLKGLKKIAVAFSSGVDSTYILKEAHDILKDNVIAITACSCTFPKRELKEAKEFCEQEKIKHITFNFNPFIINGFSQNPPDRCYLCKKELFKNIFEIANRNGIENVVEGSNIDDNSDYRPGMKAIKELGVKSPLQIAGLSKQEIRELSQDLGLKTYNKPSYACLASRFVYGQSITEEKLNMVDKAEQYLLDMGLKQVRVRISDKTARIEVMPDDFEKLINNRKNIIKIYKSYGFTYISMDLQGYRTGSMNETL